MAPKKTIKGVVVSGVGQGGYFTQLEWVKSQCLEKLGFIPYPGTFNIKVDPAYLSLLDGIKRGKGIEILPPSADFCHARSYKVSLEGKEAAVILPLVDNYPPDILEVVSPLRLKEALALKDGDRVALTFQEEEEGEWSPG